MPCVAHVPHTLRNSICEHSISTFEICVPKGILYKDFKCSHLHIFFNSKNCGIRNLEKIFSS